MKPANLLHLPTLEEDWVDKDIVVVHAVFTLVEMFVNEEWGGLEARRKHIEGLTAEDFFGDEKSANEYKRERRREWKIIKEIYDYWQTRKRTERNEIEDPVRSEDDRYLNKALSIRACLWT